VQDSPRTATAQAASDAEVLVVAQSAFDTVCRRSPSFRHALRAAAEVRLESDRTTVRDPDAVRIVNDTDWPAEKVIVDALRAIGAEYVVREDADVAVHVTNDVAAPYPYERLDALKALGAEAYGHTNDPFEYAQLVEAKVYETVRWDRRGDDRRARALDRAHRLQGDRWGSCCGPRPGRDPGRAQRQRDDVDLQAA